jgi:hypothetical protein
VTELTRVQLIACRDAVEALPGVESVDVLDPDQRLDRRALELVIGPDYDRVPPAVLRTLAHHDAGVWDVSTRESPRWFVVIVT